jgi:hypothetical protein
MGTHRDPRIYRSAEATRGDKAPTEKPIETH